MILLDNPAFSFFSLCFCVSCRSIHSLFPLFPSPPQIADILERKPNENIPGRTVAVEKPYDLIGFLCYSCPVIGEDYTGIAGFQLLLHPSNPTDPRILYPNVRPARRVQG